ncbi:hypothetical protein AAMO2058_001645000 [Amorphochlora amoebiformis]
MFPWTVLVGVIGLCSSAIIHVKAGLATAAITGPMGVSVGHLRGPRGRVGAKSLVAARALASSPPALVVDEPRRITTRGEAFHVGMGTGMLVRRLGFQHMRLGLHKRGIIARPGAGAGAKAEPGTGDGDFELDLDEMEDLMEGLQVDSPEANDNEKEFHLNVIAGPDEVIGYSDGIKAEIITVPSSDDVASTGPEKSAIVGFLVVTPDESLDLHEVMVSRLEVAPLEAFKRSLITGYLLDELAKSREISGVVIDVRSWIDEGQNALPKLRPLAAWAEKKRWS